MTCRRTGCLLFTGVVCFLTSLGQAGVAGEDLQLAPPPISYQGKTLVPIDIAYVELSLHFDVAARKATGKSKIEFYSDKAGYPFLDLVPEATAVSLNGQGTTLPSAPTPDGVTRVRYVNREVAAFSHNYLEIEYTMPSDQVTFSSGGASHVWSMSDVGDDRAFLEQYAPSNLEFDHFQMNVALKVTGARATHQLFTNGKVAGQTGDWTIVYPSYFTTSSFFLHVTEKNLSVQTGDYQGLNATIPVTVYSTSSSTTSSGFTKTKSLLQELEGTYGPFAHSVVTVYLTSGGGGMEHCGATITSLGALGHELTHSWFARGVMPANGNAGWIDEAVASWRDNGYPTNNPSNRPAVNLASFSAYRRVTPNAAYTDGARLMSEFDSMFKSGLGGLKPVLKSLFGQYQRASLTSPGLETFLESTTGKDLTATFQKYVFGKSRVDHGHDELALLAPQIPSTMISLHPRAFTKEEIRQIR